MILRVLLVVAGLATCGWALARTAQVDSCQDAGRSVFAVRTDAEADRAVERVSAECRGTAVLTATASVLSGADHPAAARRVAEEAVAREPESAAAWSALRRVALAEEDIRGVLAASARLRALDARSRAGP